MKKLSIITICYNEPNLAKTCESIINQSWQDFEWIVIDGGSNDKTLAIFEKYKGRIDKFISEPDNGIYNAMNKGIKLSSGEYLNFMNAGDYYFYNDVLKDIFADKSYNADILYGNECWVRGGEYLSSHIEQIPPKLTKEVLYITAPRHQASFIRKILFEKYGGYNEKFAIAGDYEKWFVFMKNNAIFEYIPYIVCYYNLDGISCNKNLRINECAKIIDKYFSKDEINALESQYKNAFMPKYSFFQRIFSIRNVGDNNKKYKILMVFGIRFVFNKSH